MLVVLFSCLLYEDGRRNTTAGITARSASLAILVTRQADTDGLDGIGVDLATDADEIGQDAVEVLGDGSTGLHGDCLPGEKGVPVGDVEELDFEGRGIGGDRGGVVQSERDGGVRGDGGSHILPSLTTDSDQLRIVPSTSREGETENRTENHRQETDLLFHGI